MTEIRADGTYIPQAVIPAIIMESTGKVSSPDGDMGFTSEDNE